MLPLKQLCVFTQVTALIILPKEKDIYWFNLWKTAGYIFITDLGETFQQMLVTKYILLFFPYIVIFVLEMF